MIIMKMTIISTHASAAVKYSGDGLGRLPIYYCLWLVPPDTTLSRRGRPLIDPGSNWKFVFV